MVRLYCMCVCGWQGLVCFMTVPLTHTTRNSDLVYNDMHRRTRLVLLGVFVGRGVLEFSVVVFLGTVVVSAGLVGQLPPILLFIIIGAVVRAALWIQRFGGDLGLRVWAGAEGNRAITDGNTSENYTCVGRASVEKKSHEQTYPIGWGLFWFGFSLWGTA